MNIEQIRQEYPMGLTSVAMPHDDFSRLPLFKKHNIQHIEVVPLVENNKEWIPGDSESTQQLLAKCEAYNVKPISVHCYFFSHLDHDVADKDPNARKNAIKVNKSLFQGAKDIGAKYMVAHLYGWKIENRSEKESMSLAKDVILAYLPEAERTNVIIAIENLEKSWSIKHINNLIDDINHPLLGICFDTGHAAMYGDVENELRQCGDRLTALHIHDNLFTKDDHFAPFRGKIDWRSFATALIDIGYKGPLMFESYIRNKDESYDHYFGECRRAYEKITDFILEEQKKKS